MKRVKLMLTAIGVLAAVSGTVAFKAVKFGSGTYCIGSAGGVTCPTKVTNKSFQAGDENVYRQIPAAANCFTSTVCTGTGNIIN